MFIVDRALEKRASERRPVRVAMVGAGFMARGVANQIVNSVPGMTENSIRPTALGKKNWLFFGDADAGRRGAILYTIIESCRCRGIDPYAYLRDVLTRLPSMTNWQIKHVTPEALGENFTLLFNGNRGIVRTITVRVAAMTSTVELSELCQYGGWRDAYGRPTASPNDRVDRGPMRDLLRRLRSNDVLGSTPAPCRPESN